VDGRDAIVYGDGKIRTYLPGREDGRIKPFRLIKTLKGLARHLRKGNDEPVIANVRHIKDILGWDERRFAQPA
jgi:hypothetical protein